MKEQSGGAFRSPQTSTCTLGRQGRWVSAWKLPLHSDTRGHLHRPRFPGPAVPGCGKGRGGRNSWFLQQRRVDFLLFTLISRSWLHVSPPLEKPPLIISLNISFPPSFLFFFLGLQLYLFWTFWLYSPYGLTSSLFFTSLSLSYCLLGDFFSSSF